LKSLSTAEEAQLAERAAVVLGATGREDLVVAVTDRKEIVDAAWRSLAAPVTRVQLLTAAARGLATAGQAARSFKLAHAAISETVPHVVQAYIELARRF
jgi:uncharacterized protein GlcG (DUF336 family)